MNHNTILLEHGGGGLLSNRLIAETFLPLFKNSYLEHLGDGAVFDIEKGRLCFSTDSYVINPLFFPGGDIGSLAVHGTVNDIAMCGGKPLYLSAGFILEEGFPMTDLQKIAASMAEAAKRAGVMIVTGDTKVVARGAADGLFINTSGIGVVNYPRSLSPRAIQPNDVVIVNGSIGDHGGAVLSRREGLQFSAPLHSDSAPLNGLVEEILKASPHIHCLRDATRGGLGAILAELAGQSNCQILIDEAAIPVKDEIRGVCEMLGFDPLYLANEGKMVVFASPEVGDPILNIMKGHAYGRDARIIGRVSEKGRGRVVMKTVIGGFREIDLPTGELAPRIC